MTMIVRKPELELNEGKLIWSKTPEFALAFNSFSVVIPYVEYYLNAVMADVRNEYCDSNPILAEELSLFIKQETIHARTHSRFNQRMFDQNIPGLKALTERITAELNVLKDTRSLAFNAAYCAGFECIATFDSKYLYTQCDEYFEDAEPQGANLILWHVAEEFEHRSVCHDAFNAVSGNYFERIHGLIYAFKHVGSAFMEAEELVLNHYNESRSKAERQESAKQSKRIFWRQLRYLAPRMVQIFLPHYRPANVKMPKRIEHALKFFESTDPIKTRVELAINP